MLIISMLRFLISALIGLFAVSISNAQQWTIQGSFGRAGLDGNAQSSTALVFQFGSRGAHEGQTALDGGQQSNARSGSAPGASRSANLHSLIPNIIQDQKRAFVSFPGQVAHGEHLVPVLALTATTAGLIAADQFASPYFRRTSSFNSFNSAFSGTNAGIAIMLVPVGLYCAGYFRNDSYAKQSAFLAAEAGIDGEIVSEVMKLVSQRRRPEYIVPHGNFADTFGDSKSVWNGGFPSGHAIAAFSVATVVSRRYGQRHRWVPLVAYGLAGAIGFSRISRSAHFPADVFLGSALGYSIGRFVVLHE